MIKTVLQGIEFFYFIIITTFGKAFYLLENILHSTGLGVVHLSDDVFVVIHDAVVAVEFLQIAFQDSEILT